jgi:hypothetical protein
MKTEICDLKVLVGCGRTAYFTVKGEHFVTVKFRDEQKGMAPMSISATPDLLVKALIEFQKENEDFKPACLLYQGPDFAIYYFERVL